MNCKITNDIVGCQSVFGGGIADEILLYDFESTKVVYSSDGSEVVGIDGSQVRLKGSNWEYSLSEQDGNYSISLSGVVLLDAIKELSVAKNQRFIVVFRSKNDGYKIIGDKFPAAMTLTKNVDKDKNSIGITLSSTSNSPEKTIPDSSISEDRYYKVELVDAGWACEAGGTGFKYPNYRLFYNYNGEPLDRNGRLTRFSGLSQAAYKETSASAGDFDIVGDYTIDDVKVYDGVECKNTTTGSIRLSGELVELDTTNHRVVAFSVYSTASWSVLNRDEITFFKMSQMTGDAGQTIVYCHSGTGGEVDVEFINNETREVVKIKVKSYIVDVAREVEAKGTDRVVSLPVNCNGTFSVSSDASEEDFTISVVDNVVYVAFNHTIYEDTVLNIRITHDSYADEEKTVVLTIKAAESTEPDWVIVAQFCEVEN